MQKRRSDKRRILIIDDDEDILDLLQYNFVKEGYHVKRLSESSSAIKTIKEFRPDLIILDLMMPPFNGIEICRMIRSEKKLGSTYIFFLTAKSDGYYQHAAYDVGGDEFIEKIVGLKPLLSKVSSVLKHNYIIRKGMTEITSGCLTLQRNGNAVYINGQKVVLNSHEFEILFFLAQNPGKIISLTRIVSTLWGSATFMDENTALNYIDNLRRKIGRDLIEKRINLFRLVLRNEIKL